MISHTEWQTVQVQISWLLQIWCEICHVCHKPATWKGTHWCGCCLCTCIIIKKLMMMMMMMPFQSCRSKRILLWELADKEPFHLDLHCLHSASALWLNPSSPADENIFFANSVGSDKMAPNDIEPSHQDLQCLPLKLFWFLTHSETPIWNHGSNQIQRWKNPFQKHRDERVVCNNRCIFCLAKIYDKKQQQQQIMMNGINTKQVAWNA